MKSVRERMDINAAYREVGTYRGAADICGTTPKTVKRVVEAAGCEPEGAENSSGCVLREDGRVRTVGARCRRECQAVKGAAKR